jgi:adenylylsulfate kinase-like enzyme
MKLVVWFTGRSGTGKSTLARAVFKAMSGRGLPVSCIDADSTGIVYQGLPKDPVGYERKRKIDTITTRLAVRALSRMMMGVNAVVATASPHRASRYIVRRMVEMCGARMILVHLHRPLQTLQAEDVHEHYKMCRTEDRFEHLTHYENPDDADLYLPTDQLSVAECVDRILKVVEDARR